MSAGQIVVFLWTEKSSASKKLMAKFIVGLWAQKTNGHKKRTLKYNKKAALKISFSICNVTKHNSATNIFAKAFAILKTASMQKTWFKVEAFTLS